jgi:predicted dehydrogenase
LLSVVRTPVSVGVVGLGAAGSQLARAFSETSSADLRWIADHSPAAALRAKRSFPGALVAGDIDELLDDETLDAVVIATPLVTRGALALQALERGKHVFVNAPMALDGRECDRLLTAAAARDRRLHTGDPVLFQPAVQRLGALVKSGELGELFYLRSCCHGAGDSVEGVLWDHGVPAVTLVLALLADEAIEVSCSGGSFRGASVPDVAFCQLRFATGIQAQITLSSLEPDEAHELTAVGSSGMAQLDALHPHEPLRLTDLESGAGDAQIPRFRASDPLNAESEEFIAAVRSRDAGRASGRLGAAVVSVVEALAESLERGGAGVPVGTVAEGAPPALPEPAERNRNVHPLPVRSA